MLSVDYEGIIISDNLEKGNVINAQKYAWKLRQPKETIKTKDKETGSRWDPSLDKVPVYHELIAVAEATNYYYSIPRTRQVLFPLTSFFFLNFISHVWPQFLK